RGAVLAQAVLDGALLVDVDARNAGFAGASLDGVAFGGADLRGANLAGASLRGADLGAARLNGGTVLSGAFYDALTVLPAGFDASGMVFVPEPTPALLVASGLALLLVPRRPLRARLIGARRRPRSPIGASPGATAPPRS